MFALCIASRIQTKATQINQSLSMAVVNNIDAMGAARHVMSHQSFLLLLAALWTIGADAGTAAAKSVCLSKPLAQPFALHGKQPGYGSDLTYCLGCAGAALRFSCIALQFTYLFLL